MHLFKIMRQNVLQSCIFAFLVFSNMIALILWEEDELNWNLGSSIFYANKFILGTNKCTNWPLSPDQRLHLQLRDWAKRGIWEYSRRTYGAKTTPPQGPEVRGAHHDKTAVNTAGYMTSRCYFLKDCNWCRGTHKFSCHLHYNPPKYRNRAVGETNAPCGGVVRHHQP